LSSHDIRISDEESNARLSSLTIKAPRYESQYSAYLLNILLSTYTKTNPRNDNDTQISSYFLRSSH